MKSRIEPGFEGSSEVVTVYENLLAMSPVIIPQDWGNILKGEFINEEYAQVVEDMRESLLVGNLSSSIAIGVMAQNSFHRPYIRNVDGESSAIRVYKVISGSFSCVRDGKMINVTTDSDYVVVGNMDIFSFKANESGCVLAIVDFPAFDLSYDVNEIFA